MLYFIYFHSFRKIHICIHIQNQFKEIKICKNESSVRIDLGQHNFDIGPKFANNRLVIHSLVVGTMRENERILRKAAQEETMEVIFIGLILRRYRICPTLLWLTKSPNKNYMAFELQNYFDNHILTRNRTVSK